MRLFIAGLGKLANAIMDAQAFQHSGITKWETEFLSLDDKAIVVHAGSGRQLKDCIEYCSKTKSVLIELSTGLATETMTPDFPLVICPNTSILLLKALKMVETFGSTFRKYELSITESHQSAKQTEPGTAYAFAKSLELPISRIKSVREPEIQRDQIGIPEEFLPRHAYHKIVIKDDLDELIIETKVLGHSSYANGVKKIIDAVLKNPLENRRYSVLDLVDSGML